jgi:hypothetical protein
VLLTRLPLPLRSVRLACVKPAASVRSEPGSNSQIESFDFLDTWTGMVQGISTFDEYLSHQRATQNRLPHLKDALVMVL